MRYLQHLARAETPNALVREGVSESRAPAVLHRRAPDRDLPALHSLTHSRHLARHSTPPSDILAMFSS